MEPTSTCTRTLNVGETNQVANKGAISEKMSGSYMSNHAFEMKVLP
jgi:hypothetical protein